jgi:hypothetical protein
MLEQKEIEMNGKTYILSKFPAVAGREIATQYPLSAIPKLGDYQTNKDIMFKIMAFVAIKTTTTIWLKTEDLINNHVSDWETLVKLEYAMMEYNCSFLQGGKISSFLDGITERLPGLISKMLTPSLDFLSAKEKPRSKNSKKTTA